MPRAKKPADADPLADLRDDADADRYPDAEPTPPPSVVEQVADALTEAVRTAAAPLVDAGAPIEDVLDAATQAARTFVAPVPDHASLVALWHADEVALGFLHRGGRCGCDYIARTGLGQVS